MCEYDPNGEMVNYNPNFQDDNDYSILDQIRENVEQANAEIALLEFDREVRRLIEEEKNEKRKEEKSQTSLDDFYGVNVYGEWKV